MDKNSSSYKANVITKEMAQKLDMSKEENKGKEWWEYDDTWWTVCYFGCELD